RRDRAGRRRVRVLSHDLAHSGARRAMSINRLFTIVVFGVVIGGVVAGFLAIGSPSQARERALDQRRVADLEAISSQINGRKAPLPALLPPDVYRPHDPQTGKPYAYAKEGAQR